MDAASVEPGLLAVPRISIAAHATRNSAIAAKVPKGARVGAIVQLARSILPGAKPWFEGLRLRNILHCSMDGTDFSLGPGLQRTGSQVQIAMNPRDKMFRKHIIYISLADICTPGSGVWPCLMLQHFGPFLPMDCVKDGTDGSLAP